MDKHLIGCAIFNETAHKCILEVYTIVAVSWSANKLGFVSKVPPLFCVNVTNSV